MMKSIELKTATLDDVPLLAALNKQLIEDEQSRNPMTVEQLAERMSGFLATGWTAVLVLHEGAPAGYMLYQQRSDEYFPDQSLIYVRQYFICREQRRLGIGRAAFEAIAAACFPPDAPLYLDVLAANAQGRAFWESLGFAPFCINMRRG